MILPRGQCPLGVLGYMTKTTFPDWRSRSSFSHFLLLLRLGIHSLSQRCQKCLTSSWTFSIFSWDYNWLRVRILVRIDPFWPIRKWVGVSGISSSGFADWYVRGLEFNNASAPVNAVVTSALSNTAFTARFAALIIVSCTPRSVVLVADWSATLLHCLLLTGQFCFDPAPQPIRAILSRPRQSSYHCMITSLWVVLFDWPSIAGVQERISVKSKGHLKVNRPCG